MSADIDKIKEILLLKSSTKQLVYRNSKQAFDVFKSEVKLIVESIYPQVNVIDKNIEISVLEKTPFEFHLKFSGDTLVFMMHTNVFDFDKEHPLKKTKYLHKNNLRAFCGMIQVYNFLSDTIKYNREADAGFMVARFYINFENHFYLEGEKPISYLYNDFENQVFDNIAAKKIILESITFALNFDLVAPSFNDMQMITLEQKNQMSYSSGIPTSKTLGFSVPNENIDNY